MRGDPSAPQIKGHTKTQRAPSDIFRLRFPSLKILLTPLYSTMTQRELVIELADYLAKKLETLRPEEATAARVLRELVKNQRLG